MNFRQARITLKSSSSFLFTLFFIFLFAGGCSATEPGTTASNEREDRMPYHLYTADGERITYGDLLKTAKSHDVILFGELHNNAIAHWLQHELVRDLYADTTRSLHIGMEMFEADQQHLLDEYMEGIISERSFEQEARLWNNYRTDYKPIVEFARSNGIPVSATNIPRRYANAVYHGGLDALDAVSAHSETWFAPLPVEVDKELPGYASIAEMAHGHGGDNLIYAQAVKDATMAWFIIQQTNPEYRHLHLNGTYHSDNYEGIYWYLEHYGFEGDVMTISTWEVPDPAHFDDEFKGRADVILLVSERMTRTH